MKSEPTVEVSMVFWRFENHTIGALLQKIIIPVCDRLVTWFPAWSASTKQEIRTEFPSGSGALGGICSFTFG